MKWAEVGLWTFRSTTVCPGISFFDIGTLESLTGESLTAEQVWCVVASISNHRCTRCSAGPPRSDHRCTDLRVFDGVILALDVLRLVSHLISVERR